MAIPTRGGRGPPCPLGKNAYGGDNSMFYMIFTKLKSMFTENQLNLPKSTSIEVRGKNKKNELFILALFSSPSEAKTFEH